MTDIPRNTALSVLNTLAEKHHSHLDRIITDSVDNAGLNLSMRDRKLINALIFGVLRWRGNLDWIIKHYSKTPLDKIHPEILNILRIGLYQIFFLDRIPDSAAVNTSVEMAKEIAPVWVVKFVNAVLRNAIRNRDGIRFPSIEENPARALSISKSFPLWMIQRWFQRFGIEETAQLCDAHNTIPPITIRINPLRTDRDTLSGILASETDAVFPTPYSPDGLSFTGAKQSIQDFAAFKKGLFQVQDEAAQLISFFLSPQPGERILDACAGLGGKTGHIGQLMKNSGQIIAADSDGEKLTRLNSAMQRLGVNIVSTRIRDFTYSAADSSLGLFDRILLDAPCSGLGVIRRNPDIKWDSAKKDLDRFRKKQLALLQQVSGLVKPDGMLLYAVCSVEPEENESVIHDFLSSCPDFQVQKTLPDLPFPLTPFMDAQGFIRTFPHIHGMDGFFAVCLKKMG
ncbi:MAG: 16S rRNA (cytosine(967)-C(5))-methyltransferase RsmB [Desulfosalsimonadaceae bacterium]